MASVPKLAQAVVLDPVAAHLIRWDRVDFPAGGIAYMHIHLGPSTAPAPSNSRQTAARPTARNQAPATSRQAPPQLTQPPPKTTVTRGSEQPLPDDPSVRLEAQWPQILRS